MDYTAQSFLRQYRPGGNALKQNAISGNEFLNGCPWNDASTVCYGWTTSWNRHDANSGDGYTSFIALLKGSGPASVSPCGCTCPSTKCSEQTHNGQFKYGDVYAASLCINTSTVCERTTCYSRTDAFAVIYCYRGRWARRRTVTAAADQNMPYYMPGRNNMLPYNGWTPPIASC